MASLPRIAVSGLHRGENPQPGAGIIRSLRRAFPDIEIVGLSYDMRESGIYAEDGPDVAHLVPYPLAGGDAFLRRLDVIRRHTPFDIFIPTLDAEIEVLCGLEPELIKRNIRTWLPTPETFRSRAKEHLGSLARVADVSVPATRVAQDVASAMRAGHELGFPLLVKGLHYDARLARDQYQLKSAATHLLAEWGSPVIVQERVEGPEFNVLGIGDGKGDWLGHCCIRKTQVSDKGKGLEGVIVSDARLTETCLRLIRALKWPGPFEIELIRDETTGIFVLIEINPRFPAWIDFPAMIGANFAAALVARFLANEPSLPLPACTPGTFYLRHQIEVVGHVRQYGGLISDEPEVQTQTSQNERIVKA